MTAPNDYNRQIIEEFHANAGLRAVKALFEIWNEWKEKPIERSKLQARLIEPAGGIEAEDCHVAPQHKGMYRPVGKLPYGIRQS